MTRRPCSCDLPGVGVGSPWPPVDKYRCPRCGRRWQRVWFRNAEGLSDTRWTLKRRWWQRIAGGTS